MNTGGTSSARNSRWLALLLALTAPVLLTGLNLPQQASQAGVSAQNVGDAQLADETNGADWLAYGRTYDGKRFSPIDQISFADISDLKVDWYTELSRDVGLVSTPLVAGGILYLTDSSNVVRAVDAKTGKNLWTYAPQAPRPAGERMADAVFQGRGIALWKGRVYLAGADGRLVALDAKSGRESWSVQTVGPDDPVHIVGVPLTFRDKVLVGNAASGDGKARGYVTAYDAATGAQAWRFYPGPGGLSQGTPDKTQDTAAKTRAAQDGKFGLASQPSGEFTYDPEFNTVYIATTHGTPRTKAGVSQGGDDDHLSVASIVALNAVTGQHRWHYQAQAADRKNFDTVSSIILADLKIKGRKVKALMQAHQDGLFYVLDRATGKLISAKPYIEATRAAQVKLSAGRPVETANSENEKVGTQDVTARARGAHDGQPISYNPNTGLVYIVARESTGVAHAPGASLLAWDPVHQSRAWAVALHGNGSPGTLTTAGNLVFEGRSDGVLSAYDASDGKVLWEYNLGVGIAAAPISYSINGLQYIALPAGGAGDFAAGAGAAAADPGSQHTQARWLVAFSLQGSAMLPTPAQPASAPK